MLLTRSPLGHLPEGRASLDLHVLSTPPAFVLSQDQTLRECFCDIPEQAPSLSTESSPSWRRVETGQYELGIPLRGAGFLARCTKGISSRSGCHEGHRIADESYIYGTNFRHAVEFSRSGRAPSQLFRAGQGQPSTHYPVGYARSNLTGTARNPSWSGRW